MAKAPKMSLDERKNTLQFYRGLKKSLTEGLFFGARAPIVTGQLQSLEGMENYALEQVRKIDPRFEKPIPMKKEKNSGEADATTDPAA